jgi:hypothetical protein|nr:MAG TPA: hypothetical protein [Caudoviricetes sp.]
MTNEEHSIISLLLRDFEARFNSRIECLPRYYDRTKSIDNRLRQVEDVVSKRKYNNLLIVINVFFWIVIFDTIAILCLLFS